MDFSNHVHREEIYQLKTEDKIKTIRIDHFQVGESRMLYLKFINCQGVMTVTGDFGNWVFCREFHPSHDGFVSDGYWIEKLEINSIQRPLEYCSETTADDLNRGINGGLAEYGYSGEKLEQSIQFFKHLLEHCDDEIEYTHEAFRGHNMPNFMDYDEVPFCKKNHIQLRIVFDAFDEMCKRLKEANDASE